MVALATLGTGDQPALSVLPKRSAHRTHVLPETNTKIRILCVKQCVPFGRYNQVFWRYFNQDRAVLKIGEYVRFRKNDLWNKISTVKLLKTQARDIWSVSEQNFHQSQYDRGKRRCGQNGGYSSHQGLQAIYPCVWPIQRNSNDRIVIDKKS